MSGCLKKCFIISFLLWKVIFSKDIPENYIPVYYTADTLEVIFNQNREPEKVKLQGNVKIVFEDMIIKCDSGEFIKTTGDVIAKGNLYIETSEGTIKAKDILYNINTGKGILNYAVFSSPPFLGKAEKIEKDEDILYLINGYITTCDLEKPHYRISAGRIKYKKNDYFQAQKMKFILGEKYSIFYFPRYTIDMKTKEPIVTANPSYTSKTGENVEITFAQRPGGAEAIIKERILLGKEGFGAGVNIYSKSQRYRSEGFFFKDWSDKDIEPAILLEFLKNYSNCCGNGAFLIDWRWMDNNELFYNFFHSDYITKSKKYNYFSITQNFNYGIFNFNLRNSPRDDFLNIEKLPEIRFYTPSLQIAESPVFLENDFRFTNFYKDDENYLRIANILTLKGCSEMGVLKFSPYLLLGGIDYSESENNRFNFLREVGIGFSSLMKKEHINFTEYFSPSLTLFHRELDYKKGELEYFDFLEKMDEGSFLNFGLEWFFRNHDVYTGMISIENFYDIDNEEFDTSSLKYDIKLTPYIYIEGNNEWDINEEKYLFGVNDITFNSGKFRYSIGNRYDEESNISGIEGRLSYIIDESLKYSIGLQYDINSDNISRVSFDIKHRIHCWELNIGISGNEDDFSIFIMLYPFI
ncbi:MAG: hypothetical protein N3D17_01365 [bacterium]|nr:hypothetical protein [bacterium]